MREDWIECTLGEVCFTTSGGTPSRQNKDFYNGNIPWVKSGELDKGIIYDSEEHITKEAIKKSSAKIFPKGTLLFALYGATIGKMATLGVDAATNQAICGIYKSDAFNSEYLYHNLFFQKNFLIQQGIGGAQPNISQTILKKLNIPIPPLVEQKAIVKKIEELFSSLDSGIADLKKAQDQLVIYRQAVLKKAFEGELTNINLKKTILNELIHSVEYGTSEKSLNDGEVPVLRMGNMQKGLIDWNDLKYTSNQNDIDKYCLNKEDVLFNRTNSPEHVGKTSIFLSNRKAIFAGYLIRINYDRNKLIGKFLTYYLNSHQAKIYGNDVKTDGVNQSNINGTKLKKYPIPICSIQEQHQIVQEIESRLSVCDNVEESIKESLQKAQALRQSILKKAFEGKLLSEEEIAKCKADKEYEPASVLLEKIKAEKKKK